MRWTVPAARRKLGTGNPGNVVPGSSFIRLRNTVWCQAPRVQCSEQSCPSGGAPAPGLQKRPLQWTVEWEGPRRGFPVTASGPATGRGFLPASCLMTLRSCRGRIQPVCTLPGDLCPYLGHSTKDVVAKHSEVTRDTEACSVQLLCDPESLCPSSTETQGLGALREAAFPPGEAELTFEG